MKPVSRFSRLTSITVLALLASVAVGWQAAPHPTDLQHSLLYADLWMQTSAEYVACCLQTYQMATNQVQRDMEQFRAAQSNLPPEERGMPPAVVMDLDETVLDNGTFATYLYDSAQNYSDDAWIKFQTEHWASVRLVPGAKDFISRAESLGLTIIYITNREEPLREVTIKTLAQWGINTQGLDDVSGLRLLMQKHGESIKKPRRDLVRAKYHVLAYFGDQLGDFSDEFAPNHDNTAEARREAAYEYLRLWGTRWFVLPNPSYGQYQQVLRGQADQYLRRAEK
ncbi:MAG TPA: HAD family acid phosphatase [Pirellulales bacterium]|jgi:acid phosphatase|nr:HAD family acid phosphatase [Pirellulales bacterium]